MPAPDPDDDAPAPWAAGQATPKSAPGKKRSDWREADPVKPGRGPQAAAAAVAFLALVGAVVGWLTYIGRADSVELLAVPVSQYKYVTWAANPTADADAARLLKAFQGGPAAVADQERQRFRDRLKDLADRPDTPLVVYVTALAAVRGDQVCLLLADDRPDDSAAWVGIEEVLSAVAACPAQKKALLLDVARPAADPFRGLLFDDVADRLHDALDKSPPAFPVLCSCSRGEVSLTIPERGASAFAAYLEEGLTGAADGYPPGEPDGKVTVAELAEFVARRVARWAAETRDASQTPVAFVPAGTDFVLAYRGRPAPPPPPAESPPPPAGPKPPDYPSDLAAGWALRDAARSGPARWADPAAVADLEAALLRAETPFRTGTKGEPAADDLRRLRERLANVRPPPPGPAATLFDRTAGRSPPPELVKALAAWRKLLPPPAAGAPPAAPRADEREAAQHAVETLAKGRTDDVVQLVWDGLLADRELSAEKVKAAVAALNELSPDPSAELLLLRQLAAATTLPAAAYPEAVAALIEAEDALSRASAAPRGGVPGVFARLREKLTAADEAKRNAERALFAAKTDAEVRAAGGDLKAAGDRLRGAADAAEAVRAGREAWAEAADWLRATLPGMVAADFPDATTWRDVAAAAGPVADWFADGSDDFARLRDRTAALRGPTAKLARPFQTAAVKAALADAVRGRAEDLTALTRLLDGGGLTAGDRAAAAAAAAAVSADRERKHRADFDDKDLADITPKPSGRQPPPAAVDRAKRRAEAAVGLLRLSGSGGAAGVEPLRNKAFARPSDPVGWQELGDALQKAWAAELPGAVRTAVANGRWEEADRLLRAYPGGLGWAAPPGRVGGLGRGDDDARRDWLAGRYKEYGILRTGFPQAREFFNSLAGEGRPRRGQ